MAKNLKIVLLIALLLIWIPSLPFVSGNIIKMAASGLILYAIFAGGK